MQKTHAEHWGWGMLMTSSPMCKPSPYPKAHTQVNPRRFYEWRRFWCSSF